MRNANANNAATQQRSVETAAKSKNPMEAIDVFNFTSNAENGQNFTLYCKTKSDMDSKILKWAFKLAERNVSPFYKELSMGWQPKVKQNDLNKGWARYLVAVDSKKTPVAYSMFRFDMDYGHPVLYCYEMQIDPSAHRQGLGKHMMSALEKCAKHWKMDKVVLTVLKNNVNAQGFFKSMGYILDDSSPDILEKADYEILSKSVLE
ncbi:N-alpha-acetyltransferase 40 [Haematobia irritans]|uniref:N-alpha-acetyltransferase 40 n=1 Tax=Haematobia irritans TaxID=7368 RepID=UPI003F4F8776